MFRAGHHGLDREQSFRLALPQEIAFDFRLADERHRLTCHIDKVGVHHWSWKGDGEFFAGADFAFARRDDHPAGFCICCLLFCGAQTRGRT